MFSQAAGSKFSYRIYGDLTIVLEISRSTLPSNDCREFADIEMPPTCDAHGRFVLHNGNKFELEGEDNLADMESLKRHKNHTDVGSQLHAVWLCIEHDEERMMETGVERFLREKNVIFGNIPTIYVFTKYDMLTEAIENEWAEHKTDYEIEDVDTEADRCLRERCIPRIQDLTREDHVPYIAVSTRKRFKARLEQLIQMTQKEIQARPPQQSGHADVDLARALAVAIAQRVAPGLKIMGSVRVGERSPSTRLIVEAITDILFKGYWKAVFSGADFPGRSIQDCLRVIHDDIVQVWDFRDSSEVRSPLFIFPCFDFYTAN
ncbi:hypothetical protein ID866_7702 [Astraeus odoratus]|nr:hypothetical protein ID866_7702 [Astraeus odoratus]